MDVRLQTSSGETRKERGCPDSSRDVLDILLKIGRRVSRYI